MNGSRSVSVNTDQLTQRYLSQIIPTSSAKSQRNTYSPVESIISEMAGGNLTIREWLACLLAILFLFLSVASFSQTPLSPVLGSGGAVSYRGILYFQTASRKLARLNAAPGVFEYEVDAEGKTRTKIWEWK